MRPLSSSFASAIIVHRGVPASSPLRRVFAVQQNSRLSETRISTPLLNTAAAALLKRSTTHLTSPSWPSSIRLSSAWRGGTSQLHAMATDYTPAIVVYVTVPNKETGSKLAHSIIENKLAACVNQIPGVESTYWWQGKVETDSELLLMIKTRQSLLQQLTDHVTANHPYDTPEVIAVPITGGSHKYLQWLAESTQKVLDA
ncbi:unnamed protein product [Sphagnum balticum]